MNILDNHQLSQITGGQDATDAARKALDEQLRRSNASGGLGAFSKPSDTQLNFLNFISPEVARDMIARFKDPNK
jgi:bacteriocin-like protein